ncbi:putative Terminase small subunit [Nitrospira japonica]|uniref:Putative Terminase small subunit n=1 Tax=Nitrospira japonica TaxID=1325564 RepID=A0A1W1I3E4_9BACT|nr:terminase small subunit [Nitrospira japonica]SLM47399.1 putative Terminase small subunit [Nitrospira japonica]
MNNLRLKHRRFVEEYVIDFNGAQAAIRAGYSKKTARQIGQRLLTNVDITKAIEQRMRHFTMQCELKTEAILRQLTRICFSDIRKIFDSDGKPLKLHQLDDDTAAAVSSMEVAGSSIKIRFWNKIDALSLAVRILNLFKEDTLAQTQEDKYVMIVPATATHEEWSKCVEQQTKQKPNGPFGPK